jgi:hypothetical protein
MTNFTSLRRRKKKKNTHKTKTGGWAGPRHDLAVSGRRKHLPLPENDPRTV